MKFILVIFYSLFFSTNLAFAGEIIFPKNDSYKQQRLEILSQIEDVMGESSAVNRFLNTDKIILWTNEAKVLKKEENGYTVFESTTEPNFAAASQDNKNHIKAEIERQCSCQVPIDKIAGILTANPYQAAKMYFRKNWAGHSGDEIDGYAPPIVIIYHEFSHVADYVSNPELFFDMAGHMDSQWKNKAEESAVMQQNDFVLTIAAKKKLFFDRRLSYGKNDLYWVDDFYSTDIINK